VRIVLAGSLLRKKKTTLPAGPSTIRPNMPVEPISASDLYLNACTGNGTLDAFAQTPGCITMHTLATRYVNGSHSCEPRTEYDGLLRAVLPERSSIECSYLFWRYRYCCVPHAKTQVCLDGLGRNVTESWSLWSIPDPSLPHRPNNITARYVEVFDGIFSSLHNKFRFTSHSENAHSLVNGLVNIFSSLHINLKG
jgi:hypothetical protein